MVALQQDFTFTQKLLEQSYLPVISDMLPVPSIDACLQMKDRLAISDNGWREVIEPTLKLPKGLRIHSIRKYSTLEQTFHIQFLADTLITFVR